MVNVYISIYLDSRRPLKDMQIPVKLQVNYSSKQKLYSTGIKLLKEDFEQVMGKNPKGEHKEIHLKLQAIQVKAQQIIDKMVYFSFEDFEKKMFAKVTYDEMNVYHGFEKYNNQLAIEKRFGTARSYHFAMTSFMEFKPELRYVDITPQFLSDYERYMLEKHKSITTVGIYTRSLRTIFNKAINDRIIPRDLYPFGRYKYKTPNSRNIKKALIIEEIQKIYEYKAPKGSMEEKARDMWLFSYLANGINPKDIAWLKYSNVQDDRIIFVRQKTIRTERMRQPIVIYINDDLSRIIQKWGNPSTDPDSYVFPIITDQLEGEKKLEVVRQFIKQVNKYMDRIAKKLDINKKVRFSTARHSCATILKRGGASNKIIGEKFGHQSESTTERYLDSFADDIKRDWDKVLTNFKPNS